MYTFSGMGAVPGFIAGATLRSQTYVGNDPQTTWLFREAAAVGMVPEDAEGERKFSVMLTARTEDLIRAGEFRARAWLLLFRQAWAVRATLHAGASGLDVYRTAVTPEQGTQTARTLLGQDMAKFALSPSFAKVEADAWAWALQVVYGVDVSGESLLPVAPVPIRLVSPSGEAVRTPVTSITAALPTPQVVVRQPSWTDLAVPSPSSAVAPPPPSASGGGMDRPSLDFTGDGGDGGSASGNGETAGGRGAGLLPFGVLAVGLVGLLLFAERSRIVRRIAR